MLKRLQWVFPLSVLWLPISPGLASEIGEAGLQQSDAAAPMQTRPACYMETEGGQILNLERLCSPTSENRTASPGRTVPLNGAAATSGGPNGQPCYFVDSNGRPCQ